MQIRNAITKLLTITVVAAMAAAGVSVGGGWLQPVKAQVGDGSVKFVTYASVGITPEEKVRLSVANPKGSGGNLSLSFSYYLAHGTNASSTVPVYESEWIQVPPGQFRSHDLSHADLKTEGEPKTGRAQMRVAINMIAPAGSDPEDFPGSLEVIKDGVEGSEAVELDTKYRLIIVAAKRSKLAPISLLPEENLVYTVFNPNEEGSQTAHVTTYTYDSYGNLMRQTDPVELRPGDSYSFKINRDDLRVAGEKGTGLLQLSTSIHAALMDGSVRPVKLHVSMERVGTRTGSTSGGDYFTGTVTVSSDG